MYIVILPSCGFAVLELREALDRLALSKYILKREFDPCRAVLWLHLGRASPGTVCLLLIKCLRSTKFATRL